MLKTAAPGQKDTICFLSLNGYKLFSPASTAQMGGTELQMHIIATALSRKEDYHIAYVVGDFGQAKVQHYGSIKVYATFPLTKRIIALVRAPFILFWVLIRIRPAVIIASPAGPEVGLVGVYCVFSGAKLIFRAASDVDCNGLKARSMTLIARFLYTVGIRLSRIIIVQNEKQKKDLRNFYGRESLIIKNGYYLPQPSPFHAERRAIWIGSSRQVKRPDLFFRLARELPGYQFDMILSHSGDEQLYRWCQQRSAEFPNVIFHGELSPEEVNLHLQKSRVLIGTSDYEGAPNTYSMANIYRVPVVSLHVGCQGICVQGSIAEMKREICRIMDDDSYHGTISDTAYTYALANNNIISIIQDWLSAIRQVRYSQSS